MKLEEVGYGAALEPAAGYPWFVPVTKRDDHTVCFPRTDFAPLDEVDLVRSQLGGGLGLFRRYVSFSEPDEQVGI